MSNDEIPKLLISYSWDSGEHKTWVRQLSERLRRNGIDVRLDQWHVQPGQSLTQFMETQIDNCDHVIIVCTRNYYRKSLERKGGVGYEQQIISGYIASGIPREKFIPIVREGEFEPGDNCSIPPHFSGIYALDMRSDLAVDNSIEQLLRTVFGEPAHPLPEIGKKPVWKDDDNEDVIFDLRLPTRDLDGWELRSGLAQHHRTPDTFYMPPEEERRGLKKGDIVKLIFGIDVPPDEDDSDDLFYERIWVLVTGKVGPYYIGELNSIPLTFSAGAQDFLVPGSEVVFLPEHVIDIDKS